MGGHRRDKFLFLFLALLHDLFQVFFNVNQIDLFLLRLWFGLLVICLCSCLCFCPCLRLSRNRLFCNLLMGCKIIWFFLHIFGILCFDIEWQECRFILNVDPLWLITSLEPFVIPKIENEACIGPDLAEKKNLEEHSEIDRASFVKLFESLNRKSLIGCFHLQDN